MSKMSAAEIKRMQAAAYVQAALVLEQRKEFDAARDMWRRARVADCEAVELETRANELETSVNVKCGQSAITVNSLYGKLTWSATGKPVQTKGGKP